MRQISFWASQHQTASRIFLAFSYLLMNACCFLLGSLTSALPLWFSWLLLLPFSAALVLYPSRRRKNEYRNFYRTQKTFDLVLATCTCLFIISSVSRYDKLPQPVSQQAAFAALQAPAVEKPGKKKISIHFGTKGFFAKHGKKIKSHVREIRAALRRPGGAGKAALIVLTILVALLLLYLVAALSCSAACSGAEGLAYTIALLGTGLVVFLTVLVIRRILHGPKRRPEPDVMLD